MYKRFAIILGMLNMVHAVKLAEQCECEPMPNPCCENQEVPDPVFAEDVINEEVPEVPLLESGEPATLEEVIADVTEDVVKEMGDVENPDGKEEKIPVDEDEVVEEVVEKIVEEIVTDPVTPPPTDSTPTDVIEDAMEEKEVIEEVIEVIEDPETKKDIVEEVCELPWVTEPEPEVVEVILDQVVDEIKDEIAEPSEEVAEAAEKIIETVTGEEGDPSEQT